MVGAPSTPPQLTPEVASGEFRADLGLHVSLSPRTFSGCRSELGSVRELPRQEQTLTTSDSFLTCRSLKHVPDSLSEGPEQD